MKLWILKHASEDTIDWGVACRFVVRAETEGEARTIPSTSKYGPGYEGGDFWKNPEKTTCCELTSDGPAELIVRDFLHG